MGGDCIEARAHSSIHLEERNRGFSKPCENREFRTITSVYWYDYGESDNFNPCTTFALAIESKNQIKTQAVANVAM